MEPGSHRFGWEGQDVRSMAEKLMSLKGVKYVKLNTAQPPEATTQILEEV